MTPAAVNTLRFAMRLCDLSNDEKAHLAADMIRDALTTIGERETDLAGSLAPTADAEERRAKARDKKRRQRDKTPSVPHVSPGQSVVVPGTIPTVPACPLDLSPSLAPSLSPSDSQDSSFIPSSSERESSSLVPREAPPVPGDRRPCPPALSPAVSPSLVPPGTGITEPAPALRLIDPTLKLSAESRAAAEMAGVKDVEGAWIGFVAHMQSKGIRSADFERGEWPKWFVKARTFEARDRVRETTGVRVKPAVQPTGANGTRLWKVGIAE